MLSLHSNSIKEGKEKNQQQERVTRDLDSTRGYPVSEKTPSSVSNPGVTSGMPAVCKFRKHETHSTRFLHTTVYKFATVTSVDLHFSFNILRENPLFSTILSMMHIHILYLLSPFSREYPVFLFWFMALLSGNECGEKGGRDAKLILLTQIFISFFLCFKLNILMKSLV